MRKCYLLLQSLVLFVALGCSRDKETLDVSALNLGGDVSEKTALDRWVATNFTAPYNIEIKYRWDRTELNMWKTLVPPAEDKVQPVLEVLRDAWIAPYVKVKGADFIKELAQKQIVLVGSPEYNANGTIVLGQAEAGRKVTLFVVNFFQKSNVQEVKRMLKTMHHEFGHILHQKKMFSPRYALITPDGYDATWFNYSDAQALSLGFISSYSRNTVEDDFVEMLAIMLTEGKTGFDALVNRAGTGKVALRAKEEIVRAYVRDTWGIDLTALQNSTQEAIKLL